MKVYGSKHSLERTEDDHALPKISGAPNTNFMDIYKKSFYSKKFSNDFNSTLFSGKKGYWFQLRWLKLYHSYLLLIAALFFYNL